MLAGNLSNEFDVNMLDVEMLNDTTFDGKFAVVLDNTGEVLYSKPESTIVADPNLTEMEQLVSYNRTSFFGSIVAEPSI